MTLRFYTDDDGRRCVGRDDPVCDFCLAPRPAWSYPSAPMPLAGHFVVNHSDDDWAVCDPCHRLLAAQRFDELVRFAVREQRRHVPDGSVMPGVGRVDYPPLAHCERVMRANVLRFMDARRGPPSRMP